MMQKHGNNPNHMAIGINKSRVLNFDMYHPVWGVRTGPKEYRYTDYPLSGDTSALIDTEAYRPVPRF